MIHSQQLKQSMETLSNITVIVYGLFSFHYQCFEYFKKMFIKVSLLFSCFPGKREPGFVNYTLPIPYAEPTKLPDLDAPADPSPPSCSISPPSGTVLDAFDITCRVSSFCSKGCSYCFKTDTGKNVYFVPVKNNNVGGNLRRW